MIKFVVPTVFKAIDQMTGPFKKMGAGLDKFAQQAEGRFAQIQRSANNVSAKAGKIAAGAAIVGASIITPLAAAANEAIKFEDRMADVGKTTGLQGAALEAFGQSVLKMSETTRTGIDDLVTIGEIGGQLGVAQKDLLSFVGAANQFNVALGADFAGGVEEAVSGVSKIKTLFEETRGLNIADAITRVGSAINELGAQGTGTSGNITDFIQRMGALPDAIKPALQNVAALGTLFEESSLDAQVASGGLTNFFLVANKNLGAFAAQMKMSHKAAAALFQDDPTAFATKFAASLQKMSPEQVANKLHDLKIGTQETIKVIGVLGSQQKRLAELQNVSNQAFADGTSLTNEYNKKNETTAAQIEKAMNNLKALSITIGTELLPVIGSLLKTVMPSVQAFAQWARENRGTLKTIVVIAAALGGFIMAVSGVSAVVAAMAQVIAFATKAQWLLNAAFAANPIGLVIALVAGLIVLVVAIIKHWNTWGETLAAFMGPLGLIINLIQSFRRNWSLITKAFKEGGILQGLKMIGKTILDAILAPLQKVLEIAAHLPGIGKWAQMGADKIAEFRAGSGMNLTMPADNAEQEPAKQRVYGRVTEQEAANQRMETFNNQYLGIEINDNSGRAKVTKNTGNVPVKVFTPTLGQFGQ